MTVISALVFFAIIFVSITFHEYAHGWVANKLGDPTPKLSGRLTLNPLAHIDPFGTVVMPILLYILSRGTFTFGYAKPIPINAYHFKNPKKDIKWVGLSGPSANILIALVLSLIFRLNIPFISQVLLLGIIINLILAVFNLIPIPPLDGSRVVASFLPNKLAQTYLKLEPYGIIIVLGLILIRVFDWLILPIVLFIANLLLGTNISI